ncbi:hypothetical protein [Paraburkholderia susongensis]|uniref:hypothetical protein n=1 Tax=Paraburkholderia susongensis TaxID=1515439 RepID=UPI00117E4AB1|nr:hypothetical protein [Paraburkholderia susongensis]
MNDTLVSPLSVKRQKNQPIILPPAAGAPARRIGFAINRLKPRFQCVRRVRAMNPTLNPFPAGES